MEREHVTSQSQSRFPPFFFRGEKKKTDHVPDSHPRPSRGLRPIGRVEPHEERVLFSCSSDRFDDAEHETRAILERFPSIGVRAHVFEWREEEVQEVTMSPLNLYEIDIDRVLW